LKEFLIRPPYEVEVLSVKVSATIAS